MLRPKIAKAKFSGAEKRMATELSNGAMIIRTIIPNKPPTNELHVAMPIALPASPL
jgi:hypothetical protein